MISRRLITRADDLGSFPGANRAIYQAVTEGICRNAGIMVPCSAFQDAVLAFSGCRSASLGLHATLTAEWDNVRWGPVLPASKVPSLVSEDGSFHRSPHLMLKAGVDFSQMLAEIEAQLARARSSGLEIEYLDAHMAFGWLFEGEDDSSRFEEVMADLAQREGLAYFGRTYEAGAPALRPVRGHPIQPFHPDLSGDRWMEQLCAALGEPGWDDGEIRLFVTHPAEPDAQMRQVTQNGGLPGRVAQQRERDWRALGDPSVVEACRTFGITPVRVSEI